MRARAKKNGSERLRVEDMLREGAEQICDSRQRAGLETGVPA